MTHYMFRKFSDIEDQMRASVPPTVYKYRTWQHSNHKRMLTDSEIWFAHPFTLNDPQDIRRPYRIDVTETNSDKMMTKLWEFARVAFDGSADDVIAREVGLRWQRIQEDPETYFRENIDAFHNDKAFYNPIGVFSTCVDGLNYDMWNSLEYAGCHEGYCVGFNTVQLEKEMLCTIRKIEYTDEDLIVKGIEGFTDEHSIRETLMKYTKWAYENEFRFLSYNIKDEQRIRYFSKEAVREIIIGSKANDNTTEEIVKIVNNKYGQSIPIYRIIPDIEQPTLLTKQLLS